MPRVRHKFQHHRIHPQTETLIVGTFNPDARSNYATFFYGRDQNFLWRLLPTAFGEQDLKGAATEAKKGFMAQHKIDFTDLIAEVDVEAGQESNYLDSYIDGRITECRLVPLQIQELPHLKRVGLTRKTLTGIPVMSEQIAAVERCCRQRGIPFTMLLTPARGYSAEKQEIWNRFLRT